MNALDKVIGFFSPQWAVGRMQARATMAQINAISGGKAGYASAKVNRFTRDRLTAQTKEHALPVSQFDRLVADSFDAYRNIPYIRKAVSSLKSKVVGKGVLPIPQAVRPDGSAHVEFRQRAKQLWNQLESGFDYLGMPSRGGQTLSELQRMALQACILSGEVLFRLVPLTAAEAIERDIPIPLCLQVIDACRMAQNQDVRNASIADGNYLYRGIELDVRGRRVAYHINAMRPGSTQPDFANAKRYSASEIGHIYLADDVDQYRGTPWLASILTRSRDTGDLEYNVLKSSSMASCVVASYSKPTGATRFGLNGPQETQPDSADGTGLTDADGNEITRIQPGAIINTGRDGSFSLHSPNQPNMNPEGFVQHMLRGVAAGVPGIKASTIHGDYRNSSFSSERSADNDCWPEIEFLQDWFAANFCQPIYEAVLRAAVLSGVFDGIITPREFSETPHLFTACAWQGPVARSINPLDDANSAGRRVQLGMSSLQMECAKANVDWREVIDHIAELYAVAAEKKLPAEVINNMLGVDSADVIAANGTTQPTPVESPESNTEEVIDAVA